MPCGTPCGAEVRGPLRESLGSGRWGQQASLADSRKALVSNF